MRPILIAALLATPALADDPVIENVELRRTSGSWQINVTLSHPDTGWDHYADGWRILSPDGVELGMRVLHHPHVEEQPFTRSLGGVVIPDGLSEIRVQARCNRDGWAKDQMVVTLPAD